MEQRNYQKEMEEVLSRINPGQAPSLLLHSCCAPCSSFVLESLSQYFRITIFFYNPNIYPAEEYARRLSEQKRLLDLVEYHHPVSLIEGEYEPEIYEAAAKGLESEPEGGSRCERCILLRLEKTAGMAAEMDMDYFATTLTVSPHKQPRLINRMGEELGKSRGVSYLVSNFKKRGGYARSTELSRQYGIYRQNYCGCKFAVSHL